MNPANTCNVSILNYLVKYLKKSKNENVNKWGVSHFPSIWHKIPNTLNLREKRFILPQSCAEVSVHFALCPKHDSLAGGMALGRFSRHGTQEAERERRSPEQRHTLLGHTPCYLSPLTKVAAILSCNPLTFRYLMYESIYKAHSVFSSRFCIRFGTLWLLLHPDVKREMKSRSSELILDIEATMKEQRMKKTWQTAAENIKQEEIIVRKVGISILRCSPFTVLHWAPASSFLFLSEAKAARCRW